MKIDESSVTLTGRRSFESECSIEVTSRCSFRTVFDSVAEAAEASPASAEPSSGRGDRVRLMLEQLIAEAIALISGQAAPRAFNLREVLDGSGLASQLDSAARAPRSTEFSWENVTTKTISEHESCEFSAAGTIRTADGQAIDFRLDLAMDRRFTSTRRDVDSGILRDPLVINFDGKAAELADSRFDFDLDGDGQRDSLHALAGGSAFLAIDRNGDGAINDGSELFGARSGDGFADLAVLDGDGNGWLDEADAAFASLKAWSRDANGKETISGLQEKGVGALYLGRAATPFSLKDDDNRLRGQVRASGVYLREDGRAGSLQQIDLAV